MNSAPKWLYKMPYGDNIVVRQNSDITETSTHKELISKDGVYADIYNSQFSGKTA
ncbi:hypothetical protein LBYZC6_48750 [Lacrimispora brassicae]